MFGSPRRGAGGDAAAPRGLASLVAALQQSQRGTDAAALPDAGLRSPGGFSNGRLLHQHGFGGLGLAAASAAMLAEQRGLLFGKGGKLHGGQAGAGSGGGPHSHAISPAATTYQPASPQT